MNKIFNLRAMACLMAAVLLMSCGKEEPSQTAGMESGKPTQTATLPQAATEELSPADAKRIAKDAYIYGFPMVMNYKTMWNYVVDEDNPEYKGPFNEVSCEARLYTPEDKAIVTPNADTPYCIFWMDLRAEPLVLSVPKMGGRYYSFQLIDLYTHNFAYVGTLTTGNQAGRYLLAGPGWDGEKPAGVTDVIRSETDFILNITRT